jgi:pilus assembly protein CpaB
MLRVALFLLLAVGVVGLGSVAWLSLHPPPPPPPPVAVIVKVQVLAAANTLTAGSLMKPDDVETKDVPEAELPVGARRDTPQARAELFGAMVRQTLLAHQVILTGDVMRPGDHGFLAAVLSPGKRAISIGVDAVSGTAGLIWPGDHVDLILIQQVQRADVLPGQHLSGETILSDVRVIAINQQLVQGTGGAAENAQGRTVTLEVSPEDAEKVSIATQLGHLSLSVRPVDAAPAQPGDRAAPIYEKDISRIYGANPAQPQGGATVHVFNGQSDKDYHY